MKPMLLPLLLGFLMLSCTADEVPRTFKSEHVIVVMIDGPRISETWNEPGRPNIPRQDSLLSEGVLINNFRNDGPTWTISGHSAIVTGKYFEINNSGQELPPYPNIFQQYIKQTNASQDEVWVVASKGKVEVISNSSHPNWHNQYLPSTNCGINAGGPSSGYRDDSTTMTVLMDVLQQHHPKLLLLNFRQPDLSGHQMDSLGYINGIRSTDAYVAQIWDFIQNDPVYKNKTSLIVTNDHGRHLNGVSGGYHGHGDGCEGCRKISFLGLGPDFNENQTITNSYNQTDLSATIAEILGIQLPDCEGKVIEELFK
ncbi:MAG: hypothetical protein Crog4KO_09670 [Crocinitomicaceae bacterium]